jgi:hypothetical protein
MTERIETKSESSRDASSQDGRPLKVLTAAQVCKIDHMMAELGLYGEVWLIKSNGKILLRKVESKDAIQPRANHETRTKR